MGAGRGSVSFDRVAHCYEESRGGLARGEAVALALGRWLAPRSLVGEVGVGTAVVAVALERQGHCVVGVDLSYGMLAQARSRLGPRLARADGVSLPFASGRLDGVCAVWVMHVVADPGQVMAQCGRVLRPGGRLLIACGRPDEDPGDDVGGLWMQLTGLFPRRDDPKALTALGAAVGLSPVALRSVDLRFEQSPAEVARRLEEKEYSFLWDLDDGEWVRLVAPVLAGLRALPEPDRPRSRLHRRALLVLERAGA